MKCHGKSHKNPEGAETDTRGRKGNQKALSMLGGAGKDTVTPETTNNKGTGAIRASSGASEAGDKSESTNQVLCGFSRKRICLQDA